MDVVTTIVVDAGGEEYNTSFTESNTGSQSFDETIPDTTEQEIAFAFVRTKVSELIILADGDCLLEVNDVNGTGGSISLKQNKPFLYFDGCGWDLTDVFTADVASVFVTTTDNDVRVRGHVQFDAT